VDDGVANLEEARAALRALRDQGVRGVIATPHVQGTQTLDRRVLGARLAELDAGWGKLRRLARAEFAEMRVERGVELMLDTPEPDLSDPRLRLGGRGFALVEFPRFVIPPRSADALAKLKLKGVTPVVAHPERYRGGNDLLATVEEWRAVGAYLQVNAGSVLGQYGDSARRMALELLRLGWADYVCSDYHGPGYGRPALEECHRLLAGRGGKAQVELLSRTNPQRLLDGHPPLPVAPLEPRPTLWERVRSWLV
jgi:protein-tyrosine phosphatase